MHDILHDTPIYQLILEEGREKGLEEGREKGLEEGREKGLEEGREKLVKAHKEERLNLCLILVSIVQSRFPDLANRVKELAEGVEDIAVLRQIVIKLGTAQDREDILQALTTDYTSTH